MTRDVTYAAAAVALALSLAATGFAGGVPTGRQFDPVPFEETLQTGLTGVDVEQAEAAGYAVPRAEVFYSQYRYVVGYYGLASVVASLDGDGSTDQFGRPLAVFVTDFSGTDPSLTGDGYVTLSDTVARSWVRATDAWFVVDTPARTPGGSAVLPFGDRSDARAFADAHEGTVVEWDELRARLGDRRPARRPSAPIAERGSWANRTVARAERTLDRPVSVVVGEDAPTVAAAVARAPPNTTVRIPPGRYQVNLTVEKPLTLRGAGSETILTGGGNGTVVTGRAPGIALTDLRITGVGNRGVHRPDAGAAKGSAWDRQIRLAYGYGDAAVRLVDANGSLVSDVSVETPANGVVAMDSDGTVVRNVSVDGSDRWEDGFMSVLTMYSRVVVEDSTFRGGRDAVYTHYADGTVVRDNVMSGMRYGVHEMYTSGMLVRNNTIRRTDAGVILMTRPANNVVAGNDVRASAVGVSTVGTTSYVLNNVVVDNKIGLSIATGRSVYRGNTVARNRVGVRLSTLLPTNDVYANDVVGNDRPVAASRGAQTAWAVDGRGNYWGSVPGLDGNGDGIVDRAFRPTSVVDRSARRSVGGHALARSPVVGSIRQFQSALPGLRRSRVVDPAPLARPVHPDRLESLDEPTEGQR